MTGAQGRVIMDDVSVASLFRKRSSSSSSVSPALIPLVWCGLKACLLFNLIVSADLPKHPWTLNFNTLSGPVRITDMCPGVEYIVPNNTDTATLQINVSRDPLSMLYGYPHLPTCSGHQDVMYGLLDDGSPFCQLQIQVPRGKRALARVLRLEYWCSSGRWTTHIWPLHNADVKCDFHSLPEMFFISGSNRMCIEHNNISLVKMNMMKVEHPTVLLKRGLTDSGYLLVTTDWFGIMGRAWEITSRHAIMVSTQHLESNHEACRGISRAIVLRYSTRNTTRHHAESLTYHCVPSAKIISTTQLTLECDAWCPAHLKFYLSRLSVTHPQPQLPDGLFNCSVDYYSQFQPHLDCNLRTQCENGRDETEHCPFSSTDCQGMVTSRNKCFSFILRDSFAQGEFSDHECQKLGGRLATMKTRKEQNDFLYLVKNYTDFFMLVGLKSSFYVTFGPRFVPFMYFMFRRWVDNTIVYNMNYLEQQYMPAGGTREYMLILWRLVYIGGSNIQPLACEIDIESHGTFNSPMPLASLRSPELMCTYTRQYILVCPDTQATHVILPCEDDCTKSKSTFCTATNISNTHLTDSFLLGEKSVHTYSMFTCDDGVTTLHHTFLCDYRQDCPDGSDESFCEHPTFGECLEVEFFFQNCGCILKSQFCNLYSDCHYDDHDEKCYASFDNVNEHDGKQRLYINLDGTGYFTQQVMTADNSCPRSHYLCTSDSLYCLPIYTRCNGVSDCVYGEDEQDCETVTCPGFYRCRASTVCVDMDHLCDGWGQCPQRDDELVCDMTCPKGCRCHGLAFLCSNPFPSHLFLKLRYVNAAGSKMSPKDFDSHVFLVSLSLSHCSLHNISFTKLRNLMHADFAGNCLTTLNMSAFHDLQVLRSLQLGNNPLSSIHSASRRQVYYELRRAGVSETRLAILFGELRIYLPDLMFLNASRCAIESIGPKGFMNTPQLKELDITGNTVINFPFDLLSRLHLLERVFSSNYRLCCSSLHPKHLDTKTDLLCSAPHTVLPSCTALMTTEMHGAFLWMTALCATLGSIACFIVSQAVSKMLGRNFLTCIAHLQLANLCMGSHVGIIMSADHIFDGRYLQAEKAWTNSAACKLAGFLFLLSSVVSVLITWFITVYHGIALCFPQRFCRLNSWFTATSCTVMWAVGIVLACVPFLPGLSHWGLHGQSGLCRLAQFDSNVRSQQDFGWFTVIVAVSFLLCVMVAAGQVLLFRRTPKFRLHLPPAQRPVYTSVHVMGKVSVTGAVCWLALGLLTMIRSSRAVDGLDRIRDSMVVFVLPVTSALNPLLHMWAVGTLWKRQGQEENLLQIFRKKRAQTSKKTPFVKHT